MSWEKKTRCLWLLDKLKRENTLTLEEYECLTSVKALELVYYAAEHAGEARKKVYGNEVYIRGLIKISNRCGNDCFYCGIRRSNKNCERYFLPREQILACCAKGYVLGLRTFVLQGGGGTITADTICDIISDIHRIYPDCAIMLSLGEHIRSEYEQMYFAGANHYSLYHMTADREHYERLHPGEMSFHNRMDCLRDLKDIGFRIGCGFMVGSPHQTPHTLAKELKFIEEFQPDMCGITPFVPHKDTPFSSYHPGTLLQTVYLLSLARLIRPNILLPSATVLSCIAEDGRERSIKAGANVVTVDLSPMSVRDKYSPHGNKTDRGEAKHELEQLKVSMERIGYRVAFDRGNVKRQSDLPKKERP